MIFQREPVAVLGAASALLALLVGFGLPITTQQAGLLMGLVASVVALVTRQKVTPTATLPPIARQAVENLPPSGDRKVYGE